uniref:Uncharacterized protein n=1 Tax=Romanomermis culicivorax TaxID=13658 RepID=A0A915J778_ROMCU
MNIYRCNQFLRVCLKSNLDCKTVFKVEDGSIVHPKFGFEFKKQSILEVGDASQKGRSVFRPIKIDAIVDMDQISTAIFFAFILPFEICILVEKVSAEWTKFEENVVEDC